MKKFNNGSQGKQLAVLHQRLFSVYSLKKKETQESKVGDQVIIELVYQHVLRHSAHSFVLGSFGGVRGRHFISILSLDGLLSFYEQESFAFQVYMPDFLLPFTFTYLDSTDSFLFLNGYLTFDCYSYQSIASAGSDKKLIKSWEYGLGEGIIDVQTVKRNELTIVVLSERNLYGLSQNGSLVFAKRLEYTPLAFCTYLTDHEKKLMIVIATEGRYINLYEETNLKWAMKIGQTPVCVKRIFLNQLPGGLVLLSEDGFLQCVYVGTHPSVYLVSEIAEEEIDVSKAESELRDLQKKIKSNDLDDPIVADLITMQVNIDRTVKKQNDLKVCDMMVELDSQSFVRSLQVLVQVDPPLVSTTGTNYFTNFSGRTFLESRVQVQGHEIPSSLAVRIVVTYVTNEGVAGCITKEDTLPLSLVLVEVPPVKEAQHKLTVSINKPILGVNTLFKEFSTEETSPHSIGFKLVNSEDIISILVAKSSKRYRIQSDSLAVVTLPFFALVERLKLQFRKQSDFHLTNTSSLPLEAYFECIRVHHDLNNRRKRLEDQLLKETGQYRTIQKKVLINLKDAAPKPSSKFHKILADTTRMVFTTLNKLESTEKELLLSRSCLASLNRLLRGLLELNNQRETNLSLLGRMFDTFVHDVDEQGCLEVQEATASFILRTVLSKSDKDEEKATEISKGPMKDTSRLTRHLTVAIDRITKGLNRKRNDQKGTQDEIDDEDGFPDDLIPAGTKFANLNQEISNKATKESKMAGCMIGPTNTEKKLEKKEEIAEERETQEERNAKEQINRPEDPSAAAHVAVADDDEDDAIWDVQMEEVEI
ncbi:hypothetical protein RUM43_005521 [Polyplax serrata]|uniref:ApaG domain-containing protein n=1 Tax=Polyplax serrata TaxID=468196 RepID=A0AAN8PJH9_POLSC